MPTLDRLPTTYNRRTLLGVSLGVALASLLNERLPVAAQASDVQTYLVLGSDARQDDQDQRADIIMVARVNKTAGTVRTLSIPRDLWVTIPGHGEAKINAAFQYGLAESGVDWKAGADL